MGVLVIGSGYLGGAVAARLRAGGVDAVVCSRRRPSAASSGGAPWRELDVRDAGACRELVAELEPEGVVVVHGPSDITWCEANPEQAREAHVGGARNVADAVGGRHVLLISTDNVFDGTRASSGESDAVSPANAYGAAKLAAERTFLERGNALALRVSLVHGWDPDGLRPNFATTCVRALREGRELAVPEDHWNTPVHVDDVSAWVVALLGARRTGVLHLGGPDRLSRLEWARRIAAAQGLDEGLLRPVRRADSAYACRPESACLHSERAALLPELAGLSPEGVDVSARRLPEEVRAVEDR
ncbi:MULTISPECIES: sugar nucleotide-binding protein [Actinosynnema]|uniref:SDR family oxidoreductase n=1 Tax=Actinosynnema TaxID=40566 RepID=UPI0020A45D6A|nr:sugar nucleotide-binding protein [Actinosynnema pretiosum]MCP2099012.1 dTDP-4-dehydrorhamnose reductase (EC 1.1.1.133) [Actinosynnema pretiosum]